MAVTRDQVAKLYVANFNRAPDAAGLDYWISDGTSATTTLTDLNAIAASMQAGAEASTGVASMTNSEYVISLYSSMFGRTVAADSTDVSYWTEQITLGNVTRANMIQTLILGAEASTGSATDAAVLANKTTVGLAYADAGLNGTFSVATVTADTATVDAAQADIDDLANPGQAFSLTNSATADTIIGTAGNDTITGASGTVVAGDLIIDQSSTDNDTANLVLTANYTPDNITKIENINLDWNAYTTPTYTLTNVSGAEVVTLTSSKVGFLGAANVAGAGTATIVAGSGMVGALDTAGTTNGTITGTNSTSMTVDGTTTNANNTAVTVNAGANTTTIDVGSTNGFKTTTINAGTATAITTTDIAQTTNNTTVTVNADATITANNAGAMTLNLSDGNDITMATTASVIGTSLTVAGEGDVSLTFANDDLGGETVTNSKTAGTLTVKSADTDGEDVSLVSADLIQFTVAAGGAHTVASGANLKYTAASGAINVTVGGTATTDTADVELTRSQTSVTLTGVETLNLTANATRVTGTDLTIATLATNANKVVLSGENDVALTAVTGNGEVDASALVGTLTVGTAASISVTAGSGDMTLTTTGAATNVTAIGGAGDDTVTTSVAAGSVTALLAEGDNTVTAAALAAGTLVVTAGAGDDTLTLGGSSITTGTVNANLGDGDNTVTYTDDGTSANTVTITTGSGTDAVSLADDTVANDILTINMGTGTDTLTLTNGVDLSAGTVTLSGIEIIVGTTSGADTTVDASFQAADIAGTSMTLKGTVVSQVTFEVVGAANTSTIDLSTLTIDQSVTNAVKAMVVDASANTTTAQTITGTVIADTIVAGGGNDTIVAGNGTDIITGGAGNDSITLTETTANQVLDTVIFAAAGAANGYDTIIGFNTADKLTFNNDTTIGTTGGAAVVDYTAVALVAGAAAVDISGVLGGGVLVTATADVVEITTTLSGNGDLSLGTDGTQLLKSMSSTTTAATQFTASAIGDAFYMVAYQGGNAYLYFADAGADAAVVASEITLVATLTGVTAGTLEANDFLMA
ncbi:S-layer family protein [Sulfurimonas sp.]|uniref:beta strand repeat-containing protein n=1 Tax=Sulfurimonas sp. TaxID=2022749 RepID=UPI00263977FE|nr:DUF4214 domain-containing protein [Sulfurimonas sp.]MDD3855522.1 DUF4214 domain-containing protein [Sulfurimonas sp.]